MNTTFLLTSIFNKCIAKQEAAYTKLLENSRDHTSEIGKSIALKKQKLTLLTRMATKGLLLRGMLELRDNKKFSESVVFFEKQLASFIRQRKRFGFANLFNHTQKFLRFKEKCDRMVKQIIHSSKNKCRQAFWKLVFNDDTEREEINL